MCCDELVIMLPGGKLVSRRRLLGRIRNIDELPGPFAEVETVDVVDISWHAMATEEVDGVPGGDGAWPRQSRRRLSDSFYHHPFQTY